MTGQSLIASGISMLNTKGSRAVRRLVEVLACEWGRHVIVLADADTRDGQSGALSEAWLEKLGLIVGQQVHFIGAKEFEDAFGDGVWLRVLQSRFPVRAGGSDWVSGDIAGLRRDGSKFSEELTNLVRRRCGDHRIGKPALGLALAEVCQDEQDVPEALRACFTAAREIAQG